MPLNPTSYKVICFDWDEVLGVLREKDRNSPHLKDFGEQCDLSNCARKMLYRDNNLKSYYHYASVPNENKDFYIQAFARLEFKKIFNRIYEVNNQYTSPPIAVKIITTGSYEEIRIKKALDQFYADGKKWFSKNEFPIEYFNRSYWTQGEPFDAKVHNLDKGRVIQDNFSRWEKQMPTLKKTDIYFFDNSIFNVHDVKEHGFPNATIFPTTVLFEDRPYETKVLEEQNRLSYSEDGPLVFQKLNNIIDKYDVNMMPKEEEKPLIENKMEIKVASHPLAAETKNEALDQGFVTEESLTTQCLCPIL